MSGILAGNVWESALPAKVKPLMATLADWANDDGTSIYPSNARTAWRLGCDVRTVQRLLREAVAEGWLSTACHQDCDGAKHGRGQTVEYTMHADAFPAREPFGKGDSLPPFGTKKDGDLPSFAEQKGDIPSEKGGSGAEKGDRAVSPDPSEIDPSEIDPSGLIDAREEFPYRWAYDLWMQAKQGTFDAVEGDALVERIERFGELAVRGALERAIKQGKRISSLRYLDAILRERPRVQRTDAPSVAGPRDDVPGESEEEWLARMGADVR